MNGNQHPNDSYKNSSQEQSQDTVIQDVLDRFDFDKVHKYMTSVNWQYRGNGVPTMDELKRTARYSLYQAAISSLPATNAGTGGFMAYKFPWGLSLTFQIEHKSTI